LRRQLLECGLGSFGHGASLDSLHSEANLLVRVHRPLLLWGGTFEEVSLSRRSSGFHLFRRNLWLP